MVLTLQTRHGQSGPGQGSGLVTADRVTVL